MSTPVVLVPGLGLGPESYARTVEHLVTPYHVVTLPGYGEPAGAREDLHPRALAVALAEKIRERSVLVGHSASCQIVAEAAVQDPTRIAGLILVGPTTDPRAAGWPRLAARWLRTAAWERPAQVPVPCATTGTPDCSA